MEPHNACIDIHHACFLLTIGVVSQIETQIPSVILPTLEIIVVEAWHDMNMSYASNN
jgi:hypothetical protein